MKYLFILFVLVMPSMADEDYLDLAQKVYTGKGYPYSNEAAEQLLSNLDIPEQHRALIGSMMLVSKDTAERMAYAINLLSEYESKGNIAWARKMAKVERASILELDANRKQEAIELMQEILDEKGALDFGGEGDPIFEMIDDIRRGFHSDISSLYQDRFLRKIADHHLEHSAKTKEDLLKAFVRYNGIKHPRYRQGVLMEFESKLNVKRDELLVELEERANANGETPLFEVNDRIDLPQWFQATLPEARRSRPGAESGNANDKGGSSIDRSTWLWISWLSLFLGLGLGAIVFPKRNKDSQHP